MVKPKQLGHLVLRVRDVERSEKFYADVLGLGTTTKREGIMVFMSAGAEASHELALMSVGSDAPGPEKNRVGLYHFAWEMESFADLQQLYKEMKSKDVNIGGIGDHGISIGGYFFDPDGNETILRKALAMGLDRGILLKGGPAFDPYPIAEILATTLKTQTFDILLFGKQAIDDDSFQVPTIVAHLLNLPRVNVCVGLEVADGKATCKRQIEGGEETVEVALPAVISIQKGINGIHDPRYPSLKGIMAAKKKTIDISDAPTVEPRLEVVRMEMPPDRPAGKIVGTGVEAVPELVRLLKEEAKVL